MNLLGNVPPIMPDIPQINVSWADIAKQVLPPNSVISNQAPAPVEKKTNPALLIAAGVAAYFFLG